MRVIAPSELPELTDNEGQRLQRMATTLLHLGERSLSMGAVKLALLSPLLELSGLLLPPFYVSREAREETAAGAMDVLVVSDRLWLVVIEPEAPLESYLPAVQGCLRSSEADGRSRYGLLTSGGVIELLVVAGDGRERSRRYEVSRGEDLGEVLRWLKYLAEHIGTSGDWG